METELRKATDLAPEDWRFRMELGYYYLRTGKMDNAIEAYREAAKLSADNPRPITNLGVALRRLGKTKEAIALNPSAYYAWENLASSLAHIPGREQEGKAAREKAIALGEELRNLLRTERRFGQELAAT